MPSTAELYEYDDWVFTPEHSVVRSPRSQEQTKIQNTPSQSVSQKERFKYEEAIHVCNHSECFTGMVFALPLSLLAWAGLIAFLYLIIKYFL